MYQRATHGALVIVLAASAVACREGGGLAVDPSPLLRETQPAVLLVAGDIGDCLAKGAELTARLLDMHQGLVVSLGDHAYPLGRFEEFGSCYDPFWGRHKARTRPVAGNHDYESPGAAGYFAYFGGGIGSPGAAYYRYEAGPWLILALDSNVPIGAGSMQLEWVRTQLAGHPGRCIAVAMHYPRFSSGPNGDNPQLHDLWRLLYDAHVEIVLAGHDHVYERFGEQNPDGRPEPGRGIRQFIVGTGGARPYSFAMARANSEARGVGFGILKLMLRASDYSWEFVPAEGTSFTDSGTAPCH